MLVSLPMMRLVWDAVEEISPNDLLTFSDTALVKLLLQQVSQKILLSGEEVCALYSYLGSRVSLIRDIAESRQLERDCLIEHPCLFLEQAETVGALA